MLSRVLLLLFMLADFCFLFVSRFLFLFVSLWFCVGPGRCAEEITTAEKVLSSQG